MRLAHEQSVTIPRLLVEAALSLDERETRRPSGSRLWPSYSSSIGCSPRSPTNVNQIARATNATGEVQDEMRATLDAVRRTAGRIDSAVDRLAS